MTDEVDSKRLVSGSWRDASEDNFSPPQGSREDGAAKALACVAAGGAAGLLVSLLYRAGKRPRVLSVPIGRKRGLERIVKLAPLAGANAPRQLERVRSSRESQ